MAPSQLRSLSCRLLLQPSSELLAQVVAVGQQLTSLTLSRGGECRPHTHGLLAVLVSNGRIQYDSTQHFVRTAAYVRHYLSEPLLHS